MCVDFEQAAPLDRKPSLQSILHKPKNENSTTQDVTQNVLTKYYYSHKRGCQYNQNNSAPLTHHKQGWWSACDNTMHTLLPNPLLHPPWQPSCSCPFKHEAERGPMVHTEGGGPASERKTKKNAIKYGRSGATQWGGHTNCS